jgi:hypothetical protein
MVLFYYTGPKVVTHCFAQLGVVRVLHAITLQSFTAVEDANRTTIRRATQIINHHLACAFGLFRA